MSNNDAITLDYLLSHCSAIESSKITFDFLDRMIEMTIVPGYGYSRVLEGRSFKLSFPNCIFCCTSNLSKVANGKAIEFNVWGKMEKSKIRDLFLNKFLSQTISSATLDFDQNFHRVNLNSFEDSVYEFFSFENVWGDSLWLVCTSDICVEEITTDKDLESFIAS